MFRAAPVLIAEGRVQHDRGTVHLITERVVAVGGEAEFEGEGIVESGALGTSGAMGIDAESDIREARVKPGKWLR